MLFLYSRKIGTNGVLVKLPKTFYRDSKSFNNLNMRRFIHVRLNLCFEFGAHKLIKVKAHMRNLNGKAVKVRSYYRRVWGR